MTIELILLVIVVLAAIGCFYLLESANATTLNDLRRRVATLEYETLNTLKQCNDSAGKMRAASKEMLEINKKLLNTVLRG